MTKLLVGMSLCALALMPVAMGHTAAAPPGHIDRLLHDCNDDYFGSDSGGLQSGYDVHALDIYEQWDQGLGNTVVYKLILNGNGAADVRLQLSAAGAAKTYQWSSTGSGWTGTFDTVRHVTDIGDGDRFALEGILSWSSLGVTKGDELGQHRVTVLLGSEEGDHMPGDDDPVGPCDDQYNPPGRTHALKGPVQYASVDVQQTSVTLEPGEVRFIDVQMANSLADAVQTLRLTSSTDGDAQVQFHDSAAGSGSGYSDTYEKEVTKKGKPGSTALVHLALTGQDPGDSGTVTITLTTDMGGRVQDSLRYSVAAPSGQGGGDPPQAGEDANNESPGIGMAALLVIGWVAWSTRRRP